MWRFEIISTLLFYLGTLNKHYEVKSEQFVCLFVCFRLDICGKKFTGNMFCYTFQNYRNYF